MQASAWIGLLRRIPPEQHDSLVLMTSMGMEISLQVVIRTDEDFLVIRGRLAGTTDTGRVFFVPYDQINYLGYHKEVSEAKIRALFGEEVPAEEQARTEAPSAATDSQGAKTNEAAPETKPPPATEAPQIPEQPKSGVRILIPRKSGLLERLRARASQTSGGPRSGPNP